MEEIVCKICHESKTIDHFSEKALNNVENKNVHQICFECLDEIKKKDFKKYTKKQPTGIFKKCKQCLEVKDSSLMHNNVLCKSCVKENRKLKAENARKIIKEKKCAKCENILDVSHFAFNFDSKDGYACNCKECVREYNLLYKAKNRETVNKNRSERRRNDPNTLNKERQFRENNREKTREWDRQYNKKNRKKKSARDTIYRIKRRAKDPLYKAYLNIKSNLRSYIKRLSTVGKLHKTKYYIDISVFDVIGPCPGTGEEYQLDHIIPLRAFDPNDSEMLKLAHDVNNLRWLNSEENNKKLDYIYWDVISSNERLLEIASILKLTKEDDGNTANKIFPIIDGNFIRR